MHCAECGRALEPEDKFCRNCGTRVERASPRPADAAERRLMTVLFCDLVGSTRLSMTLDPDEVHEILQMYQTVCDREIERYDGYTAQYQGDGIVVYFGYPNARSDAAERAVLAGLNMRDAVERLSAEIAPTWGVELAVRIGLHSGVAVVGEMGGGGRTELMALGDAPNIASRVQEAAGENEVLITDATAALALNRFRIESRGTPPLKGVSDPLELHVVQGVDRRSSWRRLSIEEIFGRNDELTTLHEMHAQSQQGRGQLVEVTGETGVGKSQLLWFFAGQLQVPVVDVVCREFQQQTPLAPFADWLSRRIGEDAGSGDDTRSRLENEAARLGLDADLLPGLCALLGARHPDIPADPAAARAATLEALCAMLLAQGGVAVVDDAQWADATTMEVLSMLAARLEKSQLLLLVGSRDQIPWQEGTGPDRTFALAPLGRDAAADLVRARIGTDAQDQMVEALVNRADGMPIYLVELAQAAAHSQDQRESAAVPTSLQGLLMNRLDSAGNAKRTAQEASVLGREFNRDELQAITTQTSQDMEQGLRTMVDMELLDEQVTATGLTYQFRHQLLRDLAYDSVLKRARAQLHRRISAFLEQRLDGDHSAKRQRLGRTAQHYLRSLNSREAPAAEIEKGVQLLMASASTSLELSAYVEAEADVLSAVTLTQRLPEQEARWRLETEVYNKLSVIHRATIGFGAPEVEVDLRNARTAAEKLGDDLTVATNSLAIWSLLLGGASYRESLEVAENTLALSARIEDPDIRLRALAACGNSEFWLGHPATAFDYCSRVLSDYRPEHEGNGMMVHGWDAGVHANQQAIWSAWLLGHKDVLDHEARLHALAGRIGHPLTTAMAENASCVLHVLRRDADAALAAADRLGAVADQFGLGFFQMFATLFRAEALARQGEFGETFEAADGLFRTYQDHMGGLAQTFVGAFMARVYAAQGDVDRALSTVEHALKAVETCDERVFEVSLRRQAAHLASGSKIDLAELDLCGDFAADGLSLSAKDPRNVWIAQEPG